MDAVQGRKWPGGPSLCALVVSVLALGPNSCAPAEPSTDAGDLVHLDLLERPELAELRWGPMLVIRATDGGAGKYHLGGWRTATSEAPGSGGKPVLIMSGETGGLAVGQDSSGPVRIALAARPEDGARVHLHLDGRYVASGSPDPHGRVLVDATTGWEPGPGEHSIVLRSAGALELQWLAIGPATDPAPSRMPGALIRDDNLVVDEGWTVGVSLEIPAGAALEIRGRGATGTRLRVRGVLDTGSVVDLSTVVLSRRGSGATVDLGPLSSHVARLELTSVGGDARLARCRVTAPPERAPVRHHVHPRNVLVFLADTHRADRLSIYDPKTRVETPAFTAMAAHSAVFESAHAHANWTKPSVASLMTSLMPWQHGASDRGAGVPDQIMLIPQYMQAHGYSTAGFVTNSYISRSFGFERGWDHWSHSRETRRSRAPQVVDDVVSWLDSRGGGEPFFIYVHTTDTHSPYVPSPSVLARYDPGPYEGIADFELDRLLIHSIRMGACELDGRDRTRFVALYDGEVDEHATQVGMLMEALKVRNLLDDTLVVFVSDHGEELFDHGSVGHGQTWYEEVLRVPLIIHWPSVTDGGIRLRADVGLVDLAPTIFDVVGLPVPHHLHGHSLVDLMTGQGPGPSRAVVSGHKAHWRTAVMGRYKLLARSVSRHGLEYTLFDLEDDPLELADCSCDRPLVTAWLRGMMGLEIASSPPGFMDPEARSPTLDASTLEHLRSLGYLNH